MPEIIIVGAGVIGTSIAYHLAKLGCRDVVVLEKNYIGSGSTEKSAGGIRQQFSIEINIRLSMESVRFFEHFEEETGYPADFHQHGYLILATTEEELEALRQSMAVQRKSGLEVQLLSSREIKDFLPELNVGDILGATFCPTDGYADPYSVVQGFAAAARKLGTQIYEDTEVINIEVSKDRVTGVCTTKGKFEAPVVVNAAGPYAGVVGKMAGLTLPIRPTRRHLFVTEPVFHQSGRLNHQRWLKPPMVIDFHQGFWFRREGPCLIFGMRNPNEVEGFSTAVDWNFFTTYLAPVAYHRLPVLGDIGVMRGQAGLHPDTPDDLAIMGETPAIKGLYLACGFGGHGFMHSPAAGRLMAELILRGKASAPGFQWFSLDRFQRQAGQKETYSI